MRTELTRFRVIDGKSDIVDEWMAFLRDNMKDVLLTLDAEKMYVETIFREKNEDGEYLYWYSIQGENGQDIMESESWIDKKHLEYWDLCIDPETRPVDMTTEVVMIPERISALMQD